MRDDLSFLLGSDVFYGGSRGIFGEFEDATRFVFGIESTI